MVAATHASLSTSAAVFAGGLAVGIGGAFALSRSVFAPSARPTRSMQRKARSTLGLPSADDKVNDVVSTLADDKDVPSAQQLDNVDAKGPGPAKPVSNTAIVTPVLTSSGNKRQKALQSITGKQVFPEPSSKNRMGDLDTKMDLAQGVLAATDGSASQAPAWLSGSPEIVQLSTSTGRIDKVAYESSDAVFVYESSTNAGFGSYAEREARKAEARGVSRTKVVSMQTRAGAGAAIAGYMAEKGTSSVGNTVANENANDAKTITALTNADGFLAMAPCLATLTSSNAQGSNRLVLQVSAASPTPDEQLSNNYAAVLTAAGTVGDEFAVVLSNGRQEAVNIAATVSAPGVQGHVAHVFDGAFAGAQVAKLAESSASVAKGAAAASSVADAVRAAGYASFEYVGPSAPRIVLIVPNGSHFDAVQAVLAASDKEVQDALGVIAARIVRPWSDEDLLNAIPASVECIHVLDEVRVAGMTGALFEDVQSTLMGSVLSKPNVQAAVVQPVSLHAGEHLSAAHWHLLLKAAAASAHQWQLDLESIKQIEENQEQQQTSLLGKDTQLITFVDSDASPTTLSGPLLARLFRERNSDVRHSRILSRFDNFEAGGLVRHDVLLSPPALPSEQTPLPLSASANQSDALLVSDVTALKSYDILQSLKPGGTVIINAPGWTGEELTNKLRAEDKRTLGAKNARLYLLDANKVVEKIYSATTEVRGGKHRMGKEVPKETAAPVVLAALLDKVLHFNPTTSKFLLGKILGIAPIGANGVSGVVDGVVSGIQLVAFDSKEWKKSQALSEAEASAPARPVSWKYNGFAPLADAQMISAEPSAGRATWALPAWQQMFSEAYKTDNAALRPDLPEENYVLTVTENKRLTPLDYDRNVFHMEFSTAGTGLKYDVGEALGIHGWNDADEIRDFIQWSGYDPDEIISVASLQDPSRFESRTVFHILQQRLDIFGKPPKRFYEVLSKLATDVDEAKWLRFIGSAEGQSTFRKLSEIETVTYADVLRMFPSARVPLDLLLLEVEAIKPRHYSIASAQSFVGDSVHLLIVTVDWRTPSGSPRYGQCTRYLANLKIGEQVTVSLKPSVMKLPPHTTQPIVMSGLGTGAAPFRAYIQARAVQKRQGHKIGPMIYIFGSRYKHAEYLYGEELEAYEKDGIVKVLTAFSRDQKHKIYIQHRIEQNQAEILDLLIPDKSAGGDEVQGLFTLCGPTDPLPDVQEALIKGYIAKTGKTHADGEAWLEELKEDERAVYEVY